ncbi:ISC system 2Fe-2S type ferredoxin [Buchnera aphidicola (Mollitrichosiphum nigrofasciatum)]|uniref:ISC system 2Fe-2S type ferredoxin n=1 Tax=Buchnera aphidicola TaxID=9 RepID=UPI0031B836F8
MPKIFFQPHKLMIPKGMECYCESNLTILDVALKNNIFIEHSCNKSCACSTCHCIIIKGFNSLSKLTEKEENLLDRAWGLNEYSRLSCQAKIGKEDLIVKIPLHTCNLSF